LVGAGWAVYNVIVITLFHALSQLVQEEMSFKDFLKISSYGILIAELLYVCTKSKSHFLIRMLCVHAKFGQI